MRTSASSLVVTISNSSRNARFPAEALELVELFLGGFVIHGVTYAVWPGSTFFGVFFSR